MRSGAVDGCGLHKSLPLPWECSGKISLTLFSSVGIFIVEKRTLTNHWHSFSNITFGFGCFKSKWFYVFDSWNIIKNLKNTDMFHLQFPLRPVGAPVPNSSFWTQLIICKSKVMLYMVFLVFKPYFIFLTISSHKPWLLLLTKFLFFKSEFPGSNLILYHLCFES